MTVDYPFLLLPTRSIISCMTHKGMQHHWGLDWLIVVFRTHGLYLEHHFSCDLTFFVTQMKSENDQNRSAGTWGAERSSLQRSNMDLKYQLSELVSMDNLTFDPRKENHPSQRPIFSEILCLLFTQLTNFLEVVFQCVFMLGCTAKNGQTEEEKVEKGGKKGRGKIRVSRIWC